MKRELRRDRNAFLIFLAVVPLTLLIALPMAVSTGQQYVMAKAQQQMQSGTGGTQPAAEKKE